LAEVTVARIATHAQDGAQSVRRDERRAFGVACGAHALHDGFTDVIYVMLPIWQSEFALGYAALGILRGLFVGTMAILQIPASRLSERVGAGRVLAAGTALAGIGYCVAGASTGFAVLLTALIIAGAGASTQHPIASSLVAHAFAGPRSLRALGTYNFAGDIGKMTVPAAASLLLALLSWRATLAMLGVLGIAVAAAILLLTPRDAAASDEVAPADADASGGARRLAFPLLLAIGMLDSATRMPFLTFLPFILLAKGAVLPTIGFALTLVFAGGAAGKLVCTFLGARLGVIATVCLTETLTAAGMVLLLWLPLDAALVLLPAIGVALNGTSSVLYGSVPDLVSPSKRGHAFSIFYTGTIGSGAIAPAVYGLAGDRLGIPAALVLVAGVLLLTLPLALMLRPALAARSE
jgi:MFS transporter, FSR family, fosmidomycin resistance protein